MWQKEIYGQGSIQTNVSGIYMENVVFLIEQFVWGNKMFNMLKQISFLW